MTAPSKAWFGGRSLAGIAGLNPIGGDVSCESCVLSGRGLCDGPITRPEGPSVACLKCDHEYLMMGKPWSTGGRCVMVK